MLPNIHMYVSDALLLESPFSILDSRREATRERGKPKKEGTGSWTGEEGTSRENNLYLR